MASSLDRTSWLCSMTHGPGLASKRSSHCSLLDLAIGQWLCLFPHIPQGHLWLLWRQKKGNRGAEMSGQSGIELSFWSVSPTTVRIDSMMDSWWHLKCHRDQILIKWSLSYIFLALLRSSGSARFLFCCSANSQKKAKGSWHCLDKKFFELSSRAGEFPKFFEYRPSNPLNGWLGQGQCKENWFESQ